MGHIFILKKFYIYISKTFISYHANSFYFVDFDYYIQTFLSSTQDDMFFLCQINKVQSLKSVLKIKI